MKLTDEDFCVNTIIALMGVGWILHELLVVFEIVRRRLARLLATRSTPTMAAYSSTRLKDGSATPISQ